MTMRVTFQVSRFTVRGSLVKSVQEKDQTLLADREPLSVRFSHANAKRAFRVIWMRGASC